MKTDTIAAIATAMTNSGIGIIRISGSDAIETADKILCLKEKKKLSECQTHTVHYGFVKEKDRIVDEVMAVIMRAPKSYTREDTVEIDCHGGTLVMQKILELIIKNGARPAEAGEFTKRAFLNGRIDLAQAESVIDVINAKNEFALKASMSQLGGAVSIKIKRIRGEILHEIAFIESAIDDPEHYQLEGEGAILSNKLNLLLDEMKSLLKNAENGLMLKEGIHTVIVGKPNSGKSSLLNAFVGKERAIVTDIAGTTRDAIEEQIMLGGISLNIIDTAGIRNTDDLVEKIGVDKSKEYIQNSDLILYVVDASSSLSSEDFELMELLQGRNVITLFNKSDLESAVGEDEIRSFLKTETCSISAKYGDGIEELEQKIEEMFFHGKIQINEEVYFTNVRHKASLLEAEKSLQLVKRSINDGLPEDFYSVDLMNAYEELGKIIGESVEDDLVNEIFSKFCMGK